MNDSLLNYFTGKAEEVLLLAMKLSSIPSMTGSEGNKAQFIYDLLSGSVKDNLWIDHAGNVLYLHPGKDRSCIDLYAAHIDTVFHNLNTIEAVREGNRVYAPSIYDNSINAAALIFLIQVIGSTGFIPVRDTLFAFDVGEEGQGDLKGIRYIMEHTVKPIFQVTALDLGYHAVMTCGVWSRRYTVTVSCSGGHSWHDFGADNAVLTASRIISSLYSCRVPDSPKTIYNVGTFSGGTAENSIAQHAEFSVDLRSEEKEPLEVLEKQLYGIVESNRSSGSDIQIRCTGERPGGRISHTHPLVERIDAVRSRIGLEKAYRAGSTDANIALSLGIPAITIGTALGGGSHSLNEYVEADSIQKGLEQLVLFFEASDTIA